MEVDDNSSDGESSDEENPHVVPDDRAGCRKRLEVTGKWRYLGDMILSHGQTYIGDLVAMGAASIGPGRALAHRVNPVDGDQWVLVVDWVRA